MSILINGEKEKVLQVLKILQVLEVIKTRKQILLIRIKGFNNNK